MIAENIYIIGADGLPPPPNLHFYTAVLISLPRPGLSADERLPAALIRISLPPGTPRAAPYGCGSIIVPYLLRTYEIIKDRPTCGCCQQKIHTLYHQAHVFSFNGKKVTRICVLPHKAQKQQPLRQRLLLRCHRTKHWHLAP